MVRTFDSVMRSAHLTVGLFAFLFLMMYGLSGLQMATVPFRWTLVEDIMVDVDAGAAATPRTLARALVQEGHVEGELVDVVEETAGVSLRFTWPGTEYLVSYRTGASTARVRTRVVGLVGMLNRIHQASGLRHDSVLLGVWGLMVGLISAILILLATTGLWMVFRRREERRVRAVVLAGGLVVGVGLIVAIRVQG